MFDNFANSLHKTSESEKFKRGIKIRSTVESQSQKKAFRKFSGAHLVSDMIQPKIRV